MPVEVAYKAFNDFDSYPKFMHRVLRVEKTGRVDMEFEASGVIEKMASGLRFVQRAVQADLARFKAYVEMDDAKGIEYRSAGDAKADSGATKTTTTRTRRRRGASAAARRGTS